MGDGMPSFGETLRHLRESGGLTQTGLAEKSGVKLRTIQGWEQGYRCPVSPDFFRLVRALGVSCEVFNDQSEPPPQPVRPRGRPAKPKAEAPAPKRRGRPRKAEG